LWVAVFNRDIIDFARQGVLTPEFPQIARALARPAALTVNWPTLDEPKF
jgi:hypothetical protein